MADWKKRSRWLVGGALFAAGAAWASPWDIDMIDAVMFKGYEWRMKPQPAAVAARVSTMAPRAREAGYYQNGVVAPVDRRDTAATDALVDPYADDPNHIATGDRMFRVNCAPCHGLEGAGGGPVTTNDVEKGIRRFPMVAPMLSGSSSRVSKLSDGYLYATIRNGGNGSAGATATRTAVEATIGAGMPAYGSLLTDAERWAIVAYIRTLPGAAYTPPVPPAEPTTSGVQ
jgi:mono/diheme cytochrome c family protein